MEKDPAFARRIATCMEARGIRSATELGAHLGISRQYASRLIKGESTDSFSLLCAMASLFDVSKTWLRLGLGSPSRRPDMSLRDRFLYGLYLKSPPERREIIAALLIVQDQPQSR